MRHNAASIVSALSPALVVLLQGSCGGRVAVEMGGRRGGGTSGLDRDASLPAVGDAGADGGALDGPDGGDGGPTCAAALNRVTTSPDCPACAFPPPGAPACPPGTPAIHLAYPLDGALVPPNLNVLSVQWTPYAAGFSSFEVDFDSPCLSLGVRTSCSGETLDPYGQPTGGCEVNLDPLAWSLLVTHNRGSGPMAITVRGTTDGTCASVSSETVHVSIAQEDVGGTYYYWKQGPARSGVGGGIWAQQFGNLAVPERQVSAPANASCVGCHAVSRDGSRMVVASGNANGDAYANFETTVFDETAMPIAQALGPPTPAAALSAMSPTGTYFVTSNAVEWGALGLAPNGLALRSTAGGEVLGGVALGMTDGPPTMPDWSADGTSVVYVVAEQVGSWASDAGVSPGVRTDDDHVFGGVLFTVPYLGAGAFGSPLRIVRWGGENDFYPTYAPDTPPRLVLFDRAPLDLSAGSLTGCLPNGASVLCPNDSFSNPAARLMLTRNEAGTDVIDLERANGSPAAAPSPAANSFPRFAPYIGTQNGRPIYWFTFSSTRDYGLRVPNHRPGTVPCYPPDSYEQPGAAPGGGFGPACQQPQIWMAALVDPLGSGSLDSSTVPFWVPYQTPTTHNHMAAWADPATPAPGTSSPTCSTCSTFDGPCGPSGGGCACCSTGGQLVCSGSGRCIVHSQ